MADSHPLTSVATTPPGAAHRAGHAAHAFAESKPIQFLARFGYVVRGVIYVVPGVLALRLAFHHQGAATAPTDAIATIGRQPFGHALLLVVLAGLVGYSIWGLIRAFLDPLGRGNSPRGLGRRFGYASSALTYLSFVALTLQLLAGTSSHGGQTQGLAAQVLAKPMGAWILGIIGVCWIVFAGFFEIALGWKGGFERDLRWERMGPQERWWAIRLGRIGIVARGVVFAVIGCLLVAAALHGNPHQAGGMGEALKEIARQPFGRTLLALSATGLIVFGVFSIMCARWMRTRSGGSSRLAHSSSQPGEVRHGHI